MVVFGPELPIVEWIVCDQVRCINMGFLGVPLHPAIICGVELVPYDAVLLRGLQQILGLSGLLSFLPPAHWKSEVCVLVNVFGESNVICSLVQELQPLIHFKFK